MDKWQKGDRVVITYGDRTVDGEVTLASPNSVSLMLSFEALLGGHAGMMPVLLDDDGVYKSLIEWKPVILRRLGRA